MFIKQRLAALIEESIKELQARGDLVSTPLPDIIIERPQNDKHGDYSSSIALKLARAMRQAPLEIANKIAGSIKAAPEVEQIEAMQPGFINFTLHQVWLTHQVQEIYKQGEDWGNINIGKGKRVQVEFVSVNPTGPLHVGHGRGAVLGSTIANVLKIAGYEVQTEYYINDAGSQLESFKRSLFARYEQLQGNNIEMPEDGYMGNYMIDLAREIQQKHASSFDTTKKEAFIHELGNVGFSLIMGKIRDDLKSLGVNFDNWFSEKSLNQQGTYTTVLNYLKENNYTAENEGATWFASTSLGEDKDNVLIRSDGMPTYFSYDIAYHYNKFIERRFDRVINIWGADHQGHVSRMKSAISALGINPDDLIIIICQLVTLKRDKEIVRVSKRSGDIITLKEVMDEVGADACRYVFLSRSADSQMDFDLELAKKQSADNPVYYVQYAHARISSILKLAQSKNISSDKGDTSLLNHEAEMSLIRLMVRLPEIIELTATNLEPHRLPYYALDLSTAFHSFYKQCRVITDNPDKTMARLKLVRAAQIILAKTLHLMGMSAPESM